MKLIDKSALVAEIERRKNKNQEICTAEGSGAFYEDGFILDIINTLEVKEVDLDFAKEVDVWVRDYGDTNGFFNVQELAKHFFELGLKASSNISIEVTSIDEELKENGIDPNSKEAKIIKESYYTAIEKLSAQKGE